MNKKRNLAMINGVFAGHEDHGMLAVFLDLEIDNVGEVRFGATCRNIHEQRALLVDVGALFGVLVQQQAETRGWWMTGYCSEGTFNPGHEPRRRRTSMGSLIGEQCWALFAQGHHNEPVAGIENMKGERFIPLASLRKLKPELLSGLDYKTQSLDNEIASTEQKLAALRAEREELASTYTDWETAPPGHLMPAPEPEAAPCTP